jgi:hypothetical protein
MDFLYTPNSIANTKRLLLVAPTDNQNAVILFDNGERVYVSPENAKLLVDAVAGLSPAKPSNASNSQTGVS